MRLSLMSQLGRDERGHILAMAALLLVPVFGIAGLAIDLSRQQNSHTGLQWIMDAAALAGARELNGSGNAIARADSAARAYVAAAYNENKPKFSEGVASGSSLSIVFFGEDCVSTTADPVRASCIQVTSETHSLSTTFAVALGFATMQTKAMAKAESRFVACEVPPLMLCNPYEPIGPDFEPQIGTQLVLVNANTGSDLAPGNFGLLDPPNLTSSGANVTGPLIAAENPQLCYTAGVSVATGGRRNPVSWGVNVRFDMYPPNAGQSGTPTNGYDAPPAPSVAKGYETTFNGPRCNQSQISDGLMPFPRDASFTNIGGTEIGNGNWDRQAYWNKNHPGRTQPNGYSTFTRYNTYMWELGASDPTVTPASSPNLPQVSKEQAAPSCYMHRTGLAAGPPSRRILYAALLNCQAEGVRGNSVLQVVPKRFIKLFITEPSPECAGGQTSGCGGIYTEFLGMLRPNDDEGKLRQIVQLVK